MERERDALAEALTAARAEVDELREGEHRAGAQLAAVQAWRQASAAAAPADGASEPDSGEPEEPAERNERPEEAGARAEDRLATAKQAEDRLATASGRPRSTKGQHERQREAAAGRAALRRAVGRAEAAERRLAELDEARVDAARQASEMGAQRWAGPARGLALESETVAGCLLFTF